MAWKRGQTVFELEINIIYCGALAIYIYIVSIGKKISKFSNFNDIVLFLELREFRDCLGLPIFLVFCHFWNWKIV